MARAYNVISGDGHLVISPEQWRHRVDAKYRDRAPRAFELPDGSTAILLENTPLIKRTAHEPHVPPEQWRLDEYTNLDKTPGGGTAEQRVREMDQDGVDAEILFPPGELWGLERAVQD